MLVLQAGRQRLNLVDSSSETGVICDDLSAAKIDARLRTWLANLPHPEFTGPQDHLGPFSFGELASHQPVIPLVFME